MANLYCLTNCIDLSLLLFEPVSHSNRIKYTCFDITENFIILGATSGSLYIFNRAGKFLQLIPNKHGSITQLAISSNEKYVAFATQRSLICVYVLNLSANAKPQVIVTHLLSGTQVTCIHWAHWSQEEKQFYYGDNKGQVNIVVLSSFIGHSLLNMTVHPLLFLESPIVQIDDFESLLLVSNCTKCILCNTEYEEYKQIGNKPRDGPFGACFAISNNEARRPSRILCARPGSRFWEVDFEGEVLQTHQFKTALAKPPTRIHRPQSNETFLNNCGNSNSNHSLSNGSNISNTNCLDLNKYDENDELLDYQPQNLQFSKIQMLTQDFLLAYTELGIYIFDIRSSTVVLWCNQFERIADCKVLNKDQVVIFTQTGSLYSVKLEPLEQVACSLVRETKYLECASLMRKHVKYFADRAREDCELALLNQVKDYLFSRYEYEVLNDLSVIFDAVAQCEENGDNHSSGGSSHITERSAGGIIDSPARGALNNCQQEQQMQMQANTTKSQTNAGIYVLENAFCDNLKPQSGKSAASNNERHFRDALLTVTGKFGKNIIKYKFNIFAEEQQKLVRDLIPANERSVPFKDIKALYENDSDDDAIVCRTRKQSATSTAQSNKASAKNLRNANLSRNSTSASSPSPSVSPSPSPNVISAEEKTIYNLYLICKSAQISNTNFIERYRALFDEYTARELIDLLSKLERLMLEHGDNANLAKRTCYEMYFHYLNSELIWEMDDATRDYIADGFILLNQACDIVRCESCKFPLRFANTCSFYELGSTLLRYYWSRNEQIKCFDILTQVPALFDILAKLYLAEHNLQKVATIALNYGEPQLLSDVGRNFNFSAWLQCFELFKDQQLGNVTCVNCEHLNTVESVNSHFFYTWNCFLSIVLEYLSAEELLSLIYKYSSYIPNDAVDREFYTKCLLKG